MALAPSKQLAVAGKVVEDVLEDDDDDDGVVVVVVYWSKYHIDHRSLTSQAHDSQDRVAEHSPPGSKDADAVEAGDDDLEEVDDGHSNDCLVSGRTSVIPEPRRQWSCSCCKRCCHPACWRLERAHL